MSGRKTCRERNCGFDMPISSQHCPHCGRPRLFPNVDASETPDEIAALNKCYQDAVEHSEVLGTSQRIAEFEKALAGSKALLCCPFLEVRRLTQSDNELAKTFYARGNESLEKGSHVFEGKKWDTIRGTAETALFGDANKREIHFAALSLNETGLSRYGECAVTLRTELVAHRTSAFHENMLAFFKKYGDVYLDTERLPRGFRAPWVSRAKLVVAKLADRLTSTTVDADFPALLLYNGVKPEEDDFIELHVFGDLTRRSFEHVVWTKLPKDLKKSSVKAMIYDLQAQGVTWKDQTGMR
jgi:hypothetical protein